ncbi:hypothetical protein D3C75_902890 [compost metagenome]
MLACVKPLERSSAIVLCRTWPTPAVSIGPSRRTIACSETCPILEGAGGSSYSTDSLVLLMFTADSGGAGSVTSNTCCSAVDVETYAGSTTRAN